MRTKVLLFTIFSATLFAFGAVVSLLFETTPDSRTILLIFYASLFVLIFGVVFFAGYGINYYRFRAVPPWQQTATVFRYGFLLGLLTVLTLLVSAYIGLNWPLFLVLLALITLLEVLWRRRRGVSKKR